ncbi:MAG: GIY-YIG nuclease family protein [Acidobacteriia bacterium]|nr:GIY-YIG nuclease family protein [Terriglobia bacterium]
MPHVYILRCRDGSLYTGSAKDVAARLRLHEAGRAACYTRGRRPLALAWSCEVATWGEALREERRIKRLRRADKEALISRCR